MNEQFWELVNTLVIETLPCFLRFAPVHAWLIIIVHKVQCSRLPRSVRLIRKREKKGGPEAIHHCSYLCFAVPVPRYTAGDGGLQSELCLDT